MLNRDLYLNTEEKEIIKRDISNQLDNLEKIINDKSKMQQKKLNIHLMKEGDANDESI